MAGADIQVERLLAIALCAWLAFATHGRAAETAPAVADAASPEAAQGTAPAPGWRVQCTGVGAATDCRLSQMVVLKKSKQLLLSVTVRRRAKDQPPTVMLHLPFGLYLPAGTSLKLDEAEAEKLPIESCNPRGCYAGLALDEPRLAALQAGKLLTVQLLSLNKKPINVTLSMSGFSAAYSQLP